MKEFSPKVLYKKGELVLVDGMVYKATMPSSGQLPSSTSKYWAVEDVPVFNSFKGNQGVKAEAYDSTKVYKKNETVEVGGVVYKALKGTAGSNPEQDRRAWEIMWEQSAPITLPKEEDTEVPSQATPKVIIVKEHGYNGKDGKDGLNGLHGRDGRDGVDGKDGLDGIDGRDGISLEYKWDGTKLGIKREDETDYKFTDLKGPGGKSIFGSSNNFIVTSSGTGAPLFDKATPNAVRLKEIVAGTNITVAETNDSITITAASGATPTWGSITGTLSNQTDLQSAIDAKVTANGAITGATKTKITYDAKGLVTAGADATTADIADSTNKRYVTDAQLTVIGNTSGTNTGDQDLSGLLALNQTTPQTVSNGIPLLDAALTDFTNPQHFVNKEYVDTSINFISTYYFTDTASDIGGIYYKMEDFDAGAAASTLVKSALGTGNAQALFNFATISGLPGVTSASAGLYRCHIHAKADNGTKPVKIYAEIYSRTAGGVETLLCTSDVSDYLTTGIVSYTLTASLASKVTIATTDRIIIKWLANVEATGSPIDVTFYLEDDYDSNIGLPVESAVLSNVFVRQDGTKALTANWNAGNFDITADNFITNDATASRITSFGTSKELVALDTTTYPSLAELAYVKGVTSAIQTQIDGKIPTSYLDTDGTLAANSDTKVATQKAVKTYADALIGANDAMTYKGATDCSLNPNYPAANAGDTYKVSIAGKIGGASGVNVEVGDMFICTADGTASGNQATVGTSWNVIQTNLDGAVIGPASATDGNIVLFDGTTGKLIKNSSYSPSSFEVPLTFSTGLTRSTNTVTVNTTQNIAKLSNLTSNGFVKTSGGDGTLSVDTTSYVPTTTTVNGHALSGNVSVTASDVGLGNVTNNAQTQAAIVPNTAPSAGQILVGNAGGTAYAPSTISGSGATISLASTGVVTISGIANASLSNSAITIAGTSTALGGSITQDTITGLGSTGIVKRTGANTLAIATPGTDYLTGNESITLSGDVSGTGTTAITCTLATVGATKGGTGQTTYTLGDTLYSSASNTLSKLAGNTTTTKKFLRQTGDGVNSAAPAWDTVTSSDVGLGNVENTALSTWAGSANITTLGTISTGTWSATTVAVNKGGTGQTTYTNGQLLIGNTTGNTLTKATLTAPAAGISITNGTGSITFGLANDLSAVEGLASNGMAARTATDTWAVRTITGGGGVTVTNGDGVSGNPTLGVSALQSMWIPASGIRPSATGGCAAHATSTVGVNRPDRSYLAFDTAGAEEAQFSVAFPKGWDEGTITAVFYWMHPATATNFDVIWGIEGAAFSNDDAINTAWGGQVTVTDTGGTTDDVYVSNTTSAITIGGTPAVGDVCYFRIMRRGVDAGDNLAVDAWLLGVKLFYTINTLDDT